MTEDRRKNFVERSRVSESLFRTMFEIASVGMAMASTIDRRLMVVNDKFCQITGYTREELLQMHATDFIHPDDRQSDDLKYRLAAKSNASQHLNEKRYLRKDGTVVHVRVNSAFLRNEHGMAERTLAVIEDVTHRFQAETALRASEQQLRAFLDGMPDRARLKDMQGRFIAANLSEAKALGAASVDEIIGKTLADFRPQAVAERVAAEERNVMALGSVFRVERQSAARGIWYEIIKAPILDEQGKVSGLVAIERDITQRKVIEDQLRETEYRMRELLDGIPGRAWFKDLQCRYLFMNTREAQAQGVAPESLIGKSVRDIRPPQEAEIVMAEDEQVMALGQSMRFERFSHVTGAWSEIVKAPMRRIDGTVIGLVAIARDISERKQAEEALRESERRLRALLDAIPDRAWLLDAAGHYVAVNRSYADSLGRIPEEILGKSPDDFLTAEFAAHIKVENQQVMGSTQPLRFERQPRDNQWNEIVKASIRGADGAATGMVSISRDITERKQVENELRLAKSAAEDANRAKGEFLAHMSHEMRTPMNAILGFAELALMNKPQGEQLDNLLKIDAAAKSLLRVIDDVLDFERVDAGKLKLEAIDFSLNEVLRNVRDVVEGPALAKGLALRFKVDDSLTSRPMKLKGDPARIGQILMNLCSNAIKFTQSGSIEVAVRSEGVSDDGVMLLFEVRDTGIGISADVLARLFQPFTQADSSTTRRYGGTGLGLIICKRLVELMHGRIWIESEPGKGTAVFFTLRCTISAHAAPEKAASSHALPPDAAVLHGARVLVVDDHPVNRTLLAKLLKLAGAHALPANNGIDALNLLEQGAVVDLVLMDLRMPEMDGFECARRIRADARWAALPIIAVTASATTHEHARCMAAGMNDVLVKPIQQATFFAAVAALLQHHPKGNAIE